MNTSIALSSLRTKSGYASVPRDQSTPANAAQHHEIAHASPSPPPSATHGEQVANHGTFHPNVTWSPTKRPGSARDGSQERTSNSTIARPTEAEDVIEDSSAPYARQGQRPIGPVALKIEQMPSPSGPMSPRTPVGRGSLNSEDSTRERADLLEEVSFLETAPSSAWGRVRRSNKPWLPSDARDSLRRGLSLSVGAALFFVVCEMLKNAPGASDEEVKERYCAQFVDFSWLTAGTKNGTWLDIPQNLAPACRSSYGTNNTIARPPMDRPSWDFFSLAYAGPFPLPGKTQAPWQEELERYLETDKGLYTNKKFHSLGIQPPKDLYVNLNGFATFAETYMAVPTFVVGLVMLGGAARKAVKSGRLGDFFANAEQTAE